MIEFHAEDIDFELDNPSKIEKWLETVAQNEGFKIEELNYIFMTDEGLYEINMEYLNHDNYTDIITFDNSEEEEIIEGDIFISIERVRENAETYNSPFDTELRRVLAHGLLHLCGYKDKTEKDEKRMREMEEKSLALF
ncbi:rRNA maturation RNase YbeY [Jiulongibacter sediminis]|uniref:Endoribonuclease YbeY n=1 Tax=Jiulongibacter sediminis TaxID=1605367 RepID=A0A0P7BXY4_9BACT|nr:rRNA maturation RNase YbeY [Jiulongibacter sediminis]KPM49377.1 rRNA maturation factor [Jiulongibacter sediminis]TBX26425.1 rRNA maturation factor [Jiulongibacter sediminis]